MSLSRKFLAALGIEDEKVEQIIQAHTDTITALKDERDTYKGDADQLPVVTKERDDLQKEFDDFKAKAPEAAKVQAEFDAYKLEVENEKANQKKMEAVLATLKEAKANETAIELLAAKVELDKVELDNDGAIKDVEKIVLEPLKAKYAGLFGVETNDGVPPVNPPRGNGKMSKEEYQKLSLIKQMEYAKDHPEEVKDLI